MLYFAKSLHDENTMNISLTPALEEYIQDKVKSGLYASASEVIRASLRLMHAHHDLQKQFREEIAEDDHQEI